MRLRLQKPPNHMNLDHLLTFHYAFLLFLTQGQFEHYKLFLIHFKIPIFYLNYHVTNNWYFTCQIFVSTYSFNWSTLMTWTALMKMDLIDALKLIWVSKMDLIDTLKLILVSNWHLFFAGTNLTPLIQIGYLIIKPFFLLNSLPSLCFFLIIPFFCFCFSLTVGVDKMWNILTENNREKSNLFE